jgi:hypothetical protein
MPGKNIARCGQYLKDHCKLQIGNWKFAICILHFAILSLGMTGCCRWCDRHCAQPQATCCQPAYQGQPAVYQAQPAYAAPGCCPAPAGYAAPAGYPAPVGYQPSYSQWQRPVAANGCCE